MGIERAGDRAGKGLSVQDEQTSLEKVSAFLKAEALSRKKFLIASHINPEGDALGSSIALSMALRALGGGDENTRIYNRDGVPEYLRFLPGQAKVSSEVPDDTRDFVLVLLDCNNPDRAALKGVPFSKTLVIDHHEVETPSGDLNWVEPGAPAAGLMVYRLIKSLGMGLTRDMAVNLYTAISTDTGNFRYQNTTAEALNASAELVSAGAEPGTIAENVYETWSDGRFNLLCLALQSFERINGAAIMTITQEMFRKTGTTIEDIENFTSFPRLLREVRAAALVTELPDGVIRVSLRSKGDIDVRRVAEKFGGGGHRNAAGCRIGGMKKLPDARRELFKAILEAFRKPE